MHNPDRVGKTRAIALSSHETLQDRVQVLFHPSLTGSLSAVWEHFSSGWPHKARGAHLVNGDLYGDDLAGLVGGLCIVGLAELHDVESSSTEGGSDGRRGVGLTRINRQLDDLCHCTRAPHPLGPCSSTRFTLLNPGLLKPSTQARGPASTRGPATYLLLQRSRGWQGLIACSLPRCAWLLAWRLSGWQIGCKPAAAALGWGPPVASRSPGTRALSGSSSLLRSVVLRSVCENTHGTKARLFSGMADAATVHCHVRVL